MGPKCKRCFFLLAPARGLAPTRAGWLVGWVGWLVDQLAGWPHPQHPRFYCKSELHTQCKSAPSQPKPTQSNDVEVEVNPLRTLVGSDRSRCGPLQITNIAAQDPQDPQRFSCNRSLRVLSTDRGQRSLTLYAYVNMYICIYVYTLCWCLEVPNRLS